MRNYGKPLLSIMAAIFFAWIVSVNAGSVSVSRTNLVLEYLFNNSTVDTSGNGNATQTVGATYWSEATNTGWTYAYFSGSTQLAGYTGWDADSLSAFTISFWTKSLLTDRSNPANVSFGCPPWSTFNGLNGLCSGTGGYFAQYYYSDPTRTQLIFTTKRVGWASTNAGMLLTNDYKCQLENGNQLIDCSTLKDERWHHIVIRKNSYKTIEILIDGKQAASYQNDETTMGRTISLGKGTVYGGLNEGNKFKGKLARMRIYNLYLGDSDVANLFSEYDNNPVNVIDPSVPVITISNPSTDPEQIKRLSATASTGTLTMSITSGAVCDSTLVFEDYNYLSFSSISDNGKSVCYKAVNGIKTTYAMSVRLMGITTLSGNINAESFFDGTAYKSWPGSPRLRPNDFTYPVLGAMVPVANSTSVSSMYPQSANFVDINGDGLADVLYAGDNYRAILANTGDYNFRVVYKCKTLWNWSNNTSGLWIPNYYYGDCADTNYR